MDLEKLLEEAKERRKALYESIKAAATNQELDKIELDIRKEDITIRNLEEKIRTLNNKGGEEDGDGEPAARSLDEGVPKGGFNPLATYRKNNQTSQVENDDEADVYASLEYRKAFKNYVVNGTPIPAEFIEKRTDSLTMVGDVAAVIPTTIMNRVIEDLTVEGKILSRITQTSFQGGVEIPISEVNPTATWLESEDKTSDEQKASMKAKITFSYHVLEAKIAIGLLTSTVSLQVFEATIVKNLKKAMIRALEAAIVSGTGSGQPKGFTTYDLPAKQVVTMTPTEMGTVKGWAKPEAAIDEAHDGDPLVYAMNKTTWDTYINSMVDSNGQKIGLGRIDEKGRKVLNGREVFITDRLPGMDAAKAGDIVGALVNLEEYLLNSNLAMYYKKWFDEDTNKWKHKALMIADGQMAIGKDSNNKLVGAGGLVYIKKGTESSEKGTES